MEWAGLATSPAANARTSEHQKHQVSQPAISPYRWQTAQSAFDSKSRKCENKLDLEIGAEFFAIGGTLARHFVAYHSIKGREQPADLNRASPPLIAKPLEIRATNWFAR